MSATRRLLTMTAASLTCGCLLGIRIEKSRKNHVLLTASAASPLHVSPVDVPKFLDNLKPDQMDSSFMITNQNKSNRISEIMKFGYPSLDTIRTYDNFVLSYDRRNKTANWVIEHLSPTLLQKNPNSDRSKSEFFEDKSVHPFFRSSNSDYFRSGFDRGHLAAAGNHKISQDLVNQTFVLSNISPQVGKGFNRDAWNMLEMYVRFRAKGSNNLWVCTGPLYLPKIDLSDGKKYIKYQVIGDNGVSVPTHFFKVLIIENSDGSLDLESFVMANQETDPKIPLRAFMVPIDSIERAAGFLIFHQIPRNSLGSKNASNEHLEKFQLNYHKDLLKFQKERSLKG